MESELENISNIRDYLIEEYIRKKRTYEDICKELRIGKDSLHRMLKKYDIPPRKVGKRAKKKNV